jgi:hypothetical protein
LPGTSNGNITLENAQQNVDKKRHIPILFVGFNKTQASLFDQAMGFTAESTLYLIHLTITKIAINQRIPEA